MISNFDIPDFQQRPETYIGVNKAVPEKDVFTFLMRTLGAHFDANPASILDVGCATGDLLAFLRGHFPDASLTGLDIDERLIAEARRRADLSNVTLVIGDVRFAQPGQYDLVTCFGMMGIFDDCEPLLDQLLLTIGNGGRIAVQGLLNSDDIDVRIAYKDNLNGLDWMRGFNIFSRQRILRWAERKGVCVEFHDFYMTSELPKRPHLPHRAYTLDTVDGLRRSINGLCLLLPETLMIVYIND